MIEVAVQIAIKSKNTYPSHKQFQLWANAAQKNKKQNCELTVRIVDKTESAELNQTYRFKKGATNVLSFPFDIPDNINEAILGDLVICAPLIQHEAEQQHKNPTAHWAHMVVHGVLHLQGYDHIESKQAQEMEDHEIAILQQLGFSNPYQVMES